MLAPQDLYEYEGLCDKPCKDTDEVRQQLERAPDDRLSPVVLSDATQLALHVAFREGWIIEARVGVEAVKSPPSSNARVERVTDLALDSIYKERSDCASKLACGNEHEALFVDCTSLDCNLGLKMRAQYGSVRHRY